MTYGDGFFNSLTPAEIYQQLTEGRGVDSLINAQALLYRENPLEEDRANLIASLGDLIASGWQGDAGAAARGAALPLKEHVLANADKLDHAQDLLSRQVGSFETAYNSVRPISEVPEQPLDDAFPFDMDFEKEVTAYQADAQHNIDVFRQYDGASEYNETNMPQEFHAGGRESGSVSVKSADTIEIGDSSPRRGGPGEYGGPGQYSGPGEYGGPGSSGGYPGGGSSSGYPAATGPYPGSSSGGYSGPGGGETSSAGHTTPNGYQPSSYPLPAYSQGSSGGGAPGGGGVVGGVPVSGGYSGGPGGGAGGVGARGGGVGPVVRGPGGAVGAGALAAEEAAVRRGAMGAAAGRGGAGAMGAPMGAGRGGKDEDTEHERKVLIESDAEETFGSDVLTAPQVIGDDEYED